MRLNYYNGYYEGDVKDGKPHGYGKRVWDDGDVYNGEWNDGKEHGAGKYTYASGNVYKGEWLNGKRHGKGKYTWSDGGVYEGYFVEDKIRGKGKITYANGEVYEGNFAENIPRGKGVKTYIDGTEISGDWTNRNNAECAVRKRGKMVEYGSLKNGEFIPDDVKAASVSECIAAAIENIRGAFGEGFQCLEENESFEDAVNDITISLIASEANKTRASARESAAKLVEMLDALKRAVSRAEIYLSKLGDGDYDELKKTLVSDGEDE